MREIKNITAEENISDVSQSRMNISEEIALEITHEVNSGLGTVQCLLEYIFSRLKRDNALNSIRYEKDFQKIKYHINRLASICSSMRYLHLEEELVKDLFSPSLLLRELIESYRTELRLDGIMISFDNMISDEDLESVLLYGNESFFIQMISNLITNSHKELRSIKNIEAKIKITIRDSRESISICVEDNGRGIDNHDSDPNMSSNLIEFKSKQSFGIGLKLTKRFVQSFGGRMDVLNPAVGAKIEVIIPKKHEKENLG